MTDRMNLQASAQGPYWRGEYFFITPAHTDSFADGSLFYAKILRPLNQCFSDAIKRQVGVAAAISALYFSRRPPAVFRRVSKIIVDSIQRVLRRWSTPHICKKSLVGRSPLLAYGDASASVVGVALVRWVCAASDHRHPRCVLAANTAPAKIAVLCGSGGNKHTSLASAAFNSTPAQCFAWNLGGVSAFTQTQPKGMAIGHLTKIGNRCKPIALNADHVFEGARTFATISFSHYFLPCRNGGQRRRSADNAPPPRFLSDASIVADWRMEAIHG